MTTADRAVRAMALVRGALGAAAYLDPDRTARLMGLDPDRNTQMRYLGRVFGAEDIASRARSGRASASRPSSALIAYRTGTIDRRATAALLGAVLAAAVPEAVALRRR